jgi:branched-chain amino acid transport system ATP-binding protein
MKPILEVNGLTKRFGGVLANDSINLQIPRGEIVGLIGPNGAGKSTLFNLITGDIQPDSGEIKFDGDLINGLRPDQINRMGIARTFQKLRLFTDMTVLENVTIGTLCRTSDVVQARLEAREYIEYVGLSHKADDLAGQLSTGQRKRLETARALATHPTLLLLDEVTGGVDPQGVPKLVDLMKRLREKGITLVIIEHRIKVVVGISDRMIALHLGRIIAEGSPESVTSNKDVIDSYLGEVYVRS